MYMQFVHPFCARVERSCMCVFESKFKVAHSRASAYEPNAHANTERSVAVARARVPTPHSHAIKCTHATHGRLQ